MEEDIEEYIIEHIDESFHQELKHYKEKIEKNIHTGLSFKKSFDDIEKGIQQKLNHLETDANYKHLKNSFQSIENDYAIDKFNNAAYSEEFQKELESKGKTLEEFMDIHKEYLAQDEILRFHQHNKAIFERYFKIKYDYKLKHKVRYDDLKLYRGINENGGFIIDEWSRLEDILKPPKKRVHSIKLTKFGIELTTKDVAVFMILFKGHYKMKFSSYVEFVEVSRFIFDNLHYNMLAGESKLGTSIERYLNGKELFTSKFNFEESKSNVLNTLSVFNLKEFKKYVENVKIDEFKSLIS